MNPRQLPIPAPLTPNLGINNKLKTKFVIIPITVVVIILFVAFAAQNIVPENAEIFENTEANNKYATNFQES